MKIGGVCMMKRIALLALLLGAVGSGAYATVDHLTSTYQAMYGPNKGGIAVVPVSFLTGSTAPEVEILTVCAPNEMDLRAAEKTADCNLISLYGIKISAEVKAADAKEDSVVTIDVSKLAAPAQALYPPNTNPSEDEIMQAAIQCISMAGVQHCGLQRVKVVIRADKQETVKKWKKYERVYVLKKKEGK